MPKPINNSDALAAFIVRGTEIDTILTRLTALSADHFKYTPDAITWADVGTFGRYLQRFRNVSDAALLEGEYAA